MVIRPQTPDTSAIDAQMEELRRLKEQALLNASPSMLVIDPSRASSAPAPKLFRVPEMDLHGASIEEVYEHTREQLRREPGVYGAGPLRFRNLRPSPGGPQAVEMKDTEGSGQWLPLNESGSKAVRQMLALNEKLRGKLNNSKAHALELSVKLDAMEEHMAARTLVDVRLDDEPE